MRTVAWLRQELARFPDEALCFAYEGEVTGIVIGVDSSGQGVIHCSEYDDEGKPTQLLPEGRA